MANLSVEFCGVRYENPLVLASGVLGITGDGMARVIEHGAGAVTSKSWWSKEHQGHKNPTMIGNEHWFLNAVGLPDAGPAKAREELARYRARTKAPFIANIVGGVMEDFGTIAAEVASMSPELVELNISCPNVHDEFGKPMACSTAKAGEVTRLVRQKLNENGGKDIPLVVKLSPNVENIVSIADSVMEAGADGITAINTLGPGMVIDIETAQPVLANRVGGISGHMLKLLSVKIVHDIYAKHKCPIIGTGGVSTGRDAIEIMMAGATLVGMGTAVHFRGPEVFGEVAKEMNDWCDANGVENITDIIGKVHENS
jgi:dihydroorotate dehydrogenase (NAD+) catalytic subunit